MTGTDQDHAAGPGNQKSHRPMRRVFVRRLELMASVGVYEVEKRYEQRIIVSVDLDVVDDYDGTSDRLEDVLDYGRIVVAAREITAARHFHLIETIAERLAEACLTEPGVARAIVSVEKPDIVPGCDAVGITIERTRIAR